jgi:hypothetical protein
LTGHRRSSAAAVHVLRRNLLRPSCKLRLCCTMQRTRTDTDAGTGGATCWTHAYLATSLKCSNTNADNDNVTRADRQAGGGTSYRLAAVVYFHHSEQLGFKRAESTDMIQNDQARARGRANQLGEEFALPTQELPAPPLSILNFPYPLRTLAAYACSRASERAERTLRKLAQFLSATCRPRSPILDWRRGLF